MTSSTMVAPERTTRPLTSTTAMPAGWPSHQELMHRLQRDTQNRIRRLEVKLKAGRVTISGACSSYYVKQLATLAVRSLVPSAAFDNDICVDH